MMHEGLFKTALVALVTADLGFNYKYDLRTGLQRLIDWRANHKPEEY